MKLLTEYDCVSSQRTGIILVEKEERMGADKRVPRVSDREREGKSQ